MYAPQVLALGFGRELDPTCCHAHTHTHLCINELYNVLFAFEPLEQADLINETTSCLPVSALQLDALQSVDLPVGCHHLQQHA